MRSFRKVEGQRARQLQLASAHAEHHHLGARDWVAEIDVAELLDFGDARADGVAMDAELGRGGAEVGIGKRVDAQRPSEVRVVDVVVVVECAEQLGAALRERVLDRGGVQPLGTFLIEDAPLSEWLRVGVRGKPREQVRAEFLPGQRLGQCEAQVAGGAAEELTGLDGGIGSKSQDSGAGKGKREVLRAGALGVLERLVQAVGRVTRESGELDGAVGGEGAEGLGEWCGGRGIERGGER